MRLSLIVAMTREGVIGRGGILPWRLSADLKRFKSLTMGHHVLMGRKTYESLGRPLPGRILIVISRRASYLPPGNPLTAQGLEDAIKLSAGDDEPFVIGGGEIFREALASVSLNRVERMYVTWVEAEVSGDTFFPTWNEAAWNLVASEPHAADEKNEYDTTFCIYDRITSDRD
jgi:dihydrofolate reductase